MRQGVYAGNRPPALGIKETVDNRNINNQPGTQNTAKTLEWSGSF